ncbi:hypothetical protein [Metallibacterium scheffleri]|uniref:hypothetical protein n=1 Tax=Metallibacterium scheffleri TaxID=993689 RepID=UPI0010A06F19|nr:hypothetical protein [Metallibacterium scheffleri]
MTPHPTHPLRPEIGGRYRLRLYLGGEVIAEILDIDLRRGLIYARVPDGHVSSWTRAMWRRDCIARLR